MTSWFLGGGVVEGIGDEKGNVVDILFEAGRLGGAVDALEMVIRCAFVAAKEKPNSTRQ